METIRGTVKRILFKNEENGYKVIKASVKGGPLITITGEMGPEIIPGTVADFHGDYKNHVKYGTGFKTSSYTISHNAEELLSIQIFIDTIAPNIGAERASLIVSKFGKNTLNILDNSPERLQEIRGIGKVSADSLIEAWKINREKWNEERKVYSLRAFLNTMGIKEKRVKKILGFFGGGISAEEKIRENPYILTEIDGFGFSTADFVARQLGIPENEPNRLKAFILYVLKITCNSSGHLFFSPQEIASLVNTHSIENSTCFLDKKIITVEDLEEHIEDLIKKKIVIKSMGVIYSTANYISEHYSATMISSIFKKQSDLITVDRALIDRHIDVFERENSLTLSEGQRQALYFFAEKKIYVLTGGPGTGKTTILKAIVELVKHLKLTLTCMTPTGIAAKKMASTIDHDAYTIHRRLGFKGKEWTYGEDNKFETDVVIVDETSMCDQETFYRLLSALRTRTHIIFVGDHDQLPSVSAGNVLRELINCGSIPVVRLEQIFRQSEASDIIKVAHNIKHGDSDLSLFKSDPASDVLFLRENDLAKIEQYVIKLAQKFKGMNRKFQIISARNQGPLSVDVLNNSLQGVLNPPGIEKEQSMGSFIIRRGDRVIVTKNDYELNMYNGEIGKVINIGSGFITIQIDERIIEISVDDALEKIKLAYVITAHRSQGCEYPYIILPFINQFGKNLLQRNLLYTAITRAKTKVIIIGHGSALEKAINNSSVYKRNTKLGERINECFQTKKNDFLLKQLEELQNSPIAASDEVPF